MTPKLATILSLMVLGACGTDAPANRHARDTVTNGGGVSSAYRIESPRAGVVWREGETHVIRWSRSDARPVNVGAAVGGKDKGHLAFALPAGTDSQEMPPTAGHTREQLPDCELVAPCDPNEHGDTALACLVAGRHRQPVR